MTIYAAYFKCNYTYPLAFLSGSSGSIYLEWCINTLYFSCNIYNKTLLYSQILPDSSYRPFKLYIY